MHTEPIVYAVFLIFAGAAVLGTLALYARQSLLVSYIVVGMLLGPWGLNLIGAMGPIQQASHIGVIFLLFLLGLNLTPTQLWRQMRQASIVTVVSSALFAAGGLGLGIAFGFSVGESLLIGAAATFSSTIIGLKLLPTTTLHHQHTGEVIISILLLQDIIAVVLLVFLQAFGQEGNLWLELLRVVVGLPALIAIAYLAQRYVLHRLFVRFDVIQEYIFLLAIGWCLGVAQLASLFGLSMEIGAFIGGVALATSPIAAFIAESLKPLRDFFLVMFFFSLGATFDLGIVGDVLVPALALAALLMAVKPPVFRWLLGRMGETPKLSTEVGVRLGQVSEFSLFIAVIALQSALIGERASYVIQLATVLTFMVSSYYIMLRYPTPIAVSARLRQD
jgi:Kef-type K+ transport system membrane component KefB